MTAPPQLVTYQVVLLRHTAAGRAAQWPGAAATLTSSRSRGLPVTPIA